MLALFKKLPTGVRHSAVYASAMVLAKVTAVAMLPVFTHFLTPEEYGRLDIFQTLANLISIVVGFGLADTLFRFVGESETVEDEKRAAAGVFGLAVCSGVISLIVTQAAAPWIAELLPGGVSLLQTRLILASLSLTGIILVPLSWLRLRDRATSYFFGSGGRAIAQAALVTVLLGAGFGIDGVLFAGFLCAATLAGVMAVIQWRDTGIRLSGTMMRSHGRFGGMLVLAGAATFVLDSCDRWFLAGTIGPAALANYALAAKVGIMAGFLTQPFDMWWLPRRFTVLRCDGAARCARMTEIGMIIAMLAALGVAGAGAAVVTWLTPAVYHGAIVYVPALGILAALNAGTQLITTGVLSESKTLKPIWIDGSAAVIACSGYIFLIPYLGIWGAVWATVGALCLRFMLYLFVGQKLCPIPYRWGRLALPLAMTVAGVIGCSMVGGIVTPFVIAAVCGMGIVAAAALLALIPVPEDAPWRRANA